jgi:hypothetical protein
MKYELSAPSWFDRVLCGLLHDHARWRADGSSYRRCLTFGCGMLVVKDGPISRALRKYRDQASKELKRGGRVL